MMYAAIRRDRKVFEFLRDNLCIEADFLKEEDIYKRNTLFYLKTAGWSL